MIVKRLADDANDDNLSVVHKILAALLTTSVGYTSLLSSRFALDHALYDMIAREDGTVRKHSIIFNNKNTIDLCASQYN